MEEKVMVRSLEISLQDVFTRRFGAAPAMPESPISDNTVAYLAERSSCRSYLERPVDPALVETLAAAAFCAPTKSDLQQRDIIILRDPVLRGEIDALFPGAPWIAAAPSFLVFCGNNRRQRQLHEWRGHPFANDHLDAFFNAAVDAAVLLTTFVIAAEQAGLGCCPISEVRDHAARVSDLLGLPDHVFPVVGLTLGWPAESEISLRLPLATTLHRDRFNEAGLREAVETYDARRAKMQPYARQRDEAEFGSVATYTWSEDKTRQYTKPLRADFGAFIRAKGFCLE
jgi:nitroreductase/FMN reductase [NAD(P)H]